METINEYRMFMVGMHYNDGEAFRFRVRGETPKEVMLKVLDAENLDYEAVVQIEVTREEICKVTKSVNVVWEKEY